MVRLLHGRPGFCPRGTFAVSVGLHDKLHLVRTLKLSALALLLQYVSNINCGLAVKGMASGNSNLPGVIGGVVTIIMALTSIPYVRARHLLRLPCGLEPLRSVHGSDSAFLHRPRAS